MDNKLTDKSATFKAETIISVSITVKANDPGEAIIKAREELHSLNEKHNNINVHTVHVGNLDRVAG